MQAIKNQYVAAHYHDESGGAKETDRHQRLTKRSKSSELLHEWVADMKAAGLKHIGPSLTALVQVSFSPRKGHSKELSMSCHVATQPDTMLDNGLHRRGMLHRLCHLAVIVCLYSQEAWLVLPSVVNIAII